MYTVLFGADFRAFRRQSISSVTRLCPDLLGFLRFRPLLGPDFRVASRVHFLQLQRSDPDVG
jgi:hypothetical protein